MPALDFQKMPDQLIPAIVQNADTGQVLMLGYFNDAALRQTLAEGRVTFYSRSRQQLWTKGETSGHYLHLVSLHPDCDQDAVLVLARPHGPTCHRGTTSCFEAVSPPEASGRIAAEASTSAAAPPVEPPRSALGLLAELDALIEHRRQHPVAEPGSYTARLLQLGLPRVAQKVGEEAVEAVIAALSGDRPGLAGEAADLVFHLLVLLRASGSSLADVLHVLAERHQRISTGERRPLPG